MLKPCTLVSVRFLLLGVQKTDQRRQKNETHNLGNSEAQRIRDAKGHAEKENNTDDASLKAFVTQIAFREPLEAIQQLTPQTDS